MPQGGGDIARHLHEGKVAAEVGETTPYMVKFSPAIQASHWSTHSLDKNVAKGRHDAKNVNSL